MTSLKNYYDSSNIINGISVPLPYKGLYEDILNYTGIIIETYSNKNDILYIDFLNKITISSDASSTPIITETYIINANSPKTFIIQPRLRYYRIRLTTSLYDPVTDNRKITCKLINTNTLPNKIYGSQNMPIVTDSSGNLSLPSIESLIGETNTILENLSVAVDLSGASISVDMSGTDLILTNIYNDVSGLPTSLNLLHNDISGGFMLLHQDLQNLDISGGSVDMSGTNLILTQIHNDVSGLDSKLITIHNDVSGITSNFNQIHNDVSGLDSKLITIHNDVSGITTISTQIHNDVSGLDSKLITIHNDVSGITTSFNIIHNDISGLDSKLITIHNDVSGITTISTQIHNDVSGITTGFNQIHNDVSGISTSFNIIHNDVSGITTSFNIIHNDISGLDSKLITIHNDVSGITTISTQIHNDVSGLDSKLITIHNDVSGLDSKLITIHNDVSGLDSKLITIHNDVSGLDSRLVTIHNDVSGITTISTQIHNDVSGLDSKLITIHNDVSGLDSKLITIHNDVSGITTSLDIIHNDVSGISTGFTDLDTDLMAIHLDLSGTNYLLTEILNATGSLDISGTFNFDLSGVIQGITLLHNDVSGLDSRLVTIHNDVSGITTISTQIHNDVSGFSNLQFDTSKNLLTSEMNNFTINTATNKTKSQFISIIADNGGIVLNGIDGFRDFVYGPTDASGAFYVFNSIKNNIKLSSSSASDVSTYSILITGLSDTYSIISETLNLNGTSQVTSTNQYFRLNSLEVITAPSNGLTFVNPLNGNITITDSSSNIFGTIDSTSGKRLAGVYTVPVGHKLLITKLELSEDTNQGGTVYIYTRDATSTNKRFNLIGKYYFSNGVREINRDTNPYVISEKTDLLLRIKTDGNAYCILSAILSI
jgi:archaellum component FlaC